MVIKSHLSPSSARALKKGTEHLIEYWNTELDLQALTFGIAFESLLTSGTLPPEIAFFEKPSPNQTMAANINKEAYAALVAEGKKVLPISDKLILDRLVANCARYRDTLKLANCKRQVRCEVELHGVKWVGFCDLHDGDVTEIKALRDASNKGLKKAIYENLYHVQLRIYQLALGADKCKMIVGEKSAPYMTNYVELSEEWLKLADYEIEVLSKKFLQWQEACQMTGGIVRNTGYGSSVMASVIAPERWMM